LYDFSTSSENKDIISFCLYFYDGDSFSACVSLYTMQDYQNGVEACDVAAWTLHDICNFAEVRGWY
jgi:hypothetical protein